MNCPVHAAELIHNGTQAEDSIESHNEAYDEAMADISTALDTIEPDEDEQMETLSEFALELIATVERLDRVGESRVAKQSAMLAAVQKFRKAKATAYADQVCGE